MIEWSGKDFDIVGVKDLKFKDNQKEMVQIQHKRDGSRSSMGKGTEKQIG